MGMGGQIHDLVTLYPEKSPGINLIGFWMGFRVSMDALGKRQVAFLCQEPNRCSSL